MKRDLLVSVVIPTWNESTQIQACLDQFQRLEGNWEVIVSDGGSSDATPDMAEALGARVVRCAARGRGPQQNEGAKVASGRIFLFLHADGRLPEDAHRWITETLLKPVILAGAFRVRHMAGAWRGWRIGILRLADLRSRWTRAPYGDQAIFVRASIFRACGGFSAQPLMEDLELVRRLRRLGRLRILPAEVRVSGRRFERGPLRAFLCMNTFPLLDRLGVDPRTLSRWYGNPR